MVAKTTFDEFARFYMDAEEWPGDGSVFHDEAAVEVDGVLYDDDIVNNGSRDFDEVVLAVEAYPEEHRFDSGATVRIIAGSVFHGENDDDPVSLEQKFNRWRRRQTETTLAVSVDRERADEAKDLIRDALKQAGIKTRF